MQNNASFLGQPAPQAEFKRSYLPISSVSMIGECETKYADAIFGRTFATMAMKIGAKRHEELAAALPKVSKEDIIKNIKEGRAFEAREITVADEKYKLKGRVDQLNLTGRVVNGKSEAIVIDDKYTRMIYDSIPLHYKLQLAAYASAICGSHDYGSMCEVTGAKLLCRSRENHMVTKEFSVGNEELASWKANVPLAAKVAWVIYNKERQPVHRKLDVATGEWDRCSCSNIR